MKVLIVKNITREGPGILEGLLKEHRIDYDIVDLDSGERFPNPLKYSALFVLGGPDSANDSTGKMEMELEQIRAASEAGLPYLGACLGMQTLVKANGGYVMPSNVKEVGWKDTDGEFFSIDLTSEGKKDPLFKGLSSPLRIFHLHGETVELTDDMTLLATGKFCTNQVVRIGEVAYGLQGHFELTPEMFHRWIKEDPDLLKIPKSQLESDYSEIREEYEATGRRMLTNFLEIASLI